MKNIASLTEKQNQWLKDYEGVTGFEPMHLDELEAGSMTFDEAARSNIAWYDMHSKDALNSITSAVPFDNPA